MSERRDRFDPELAELFSDDPELLELAQLVRESRPEPALDPSHFTLSARGIIVVGKGDKVVA